MVSENEREECPRCGISTKMGLYVSKDGKTFICGHCKAEEEENTDENLKKRYLDLYSQIYQVKCFSAKDVTELNDIETELIERGYDITENMKIVKWKNNK